MGGTRGRGTGLANETTGMTRRVGTEIDGGATIGRQAIIQTVETVIMRRDIEVDMNQGRGSELLLYVSCILGALCVPYWRDCGYVHTT